MKNVLIISPSLQVKGGISSVIKSYLASDLPKNHNIYMVASHVDGRKWIKLVKAVIGLVETFCYLAFKHIDIVHIHSGNIISFKRKFYYIKLVSYFNCKTIFHHHGGSLIEQYEMTSKRWQYLISHTLNNVDAVICLSENWKKSILKIAFAANVQVIPNCVNLPEPFEKDASIVAKLTFLGHIKEKKGIFDLLRIIKRLINKGFNVKLTIGGIGDIKRLNAELNRLSIPDNIEFLGWLSEEDRDSLLRKTGIFVLPSYAEAMPMSILEAMSYSIPVVSTFVGGIPELVSDGESGFLIMPGDLDALYRSLASLIQNKELREEFGHKGRLIIKTNHNIDLVSQKIDSIYNSL